MQTSDLAEHRECEKDAAAWVSSHSERVVHRVRQEVSPVRTRTHSCEKQKGREYDLKEPGKESNKGHAFRRMEQDYEAETCSKKVELSATSISQQGKLNQLVKIYKRPRFIGTTRNSSTDDVSDTVCLSRLPSTFCYISI